MLIRFAFVVSEEDNKIDLDTSYAVPNVINKSIIFHQHYSSVHLLIYS
jgi:hypothetical protein